MRHVHIFESVDAGLDQCVDCLQTRRNAATVDPGVLHECRCGRGLARFLDGDRTPEPICASCLAEGSTRKAVA